jgi:hypothetical protein
LQRARSDAEALAAVIVHDAGRPAPQINRVIAGAEADLSWPAHRLIVELDGPQFHRDRGEDARKEAIWQRAGWAVVRLPTDDVYDRPDRLLEISPQPIPLPAKTPSGS